MIGYARLVVFKIYACEGKGLSAVAREQDSERVNRPFVVISITAAQRVDVGRHQQNGLAAACGDFQLRDNATFDVQRIYEIEKSSSGSQSVMPTSAALSPAVTAMPQSPSCWSGSL